MSLLYTAWQGVFVGLLPSGFNLQGNRPVQWADAAEMGHSSRAVECRVGEVAVVR